jgi:hypothetical protein
MMRGDHPRFATALDESRQLARHAAPRDRRLGDRRQAFPRHVVDDVQDAEPPAAGELVVHEIDRPARVGAGFDQHRRPHSYGAPPRPPFAHREALFPVKSVDAVDPRPLALLTQQDEQSSIAEPPALVGKITPPHPQLGLLGPPRPVADHLAIGADEGAGPPFRQAHRGPQMRDTLALGGGPYHCFDRSSRSADASSIASASSFFSFPFTPQTPLEFVGTSSSCFRRFASDASMPPYLALQL